MSNGRGQDGLSAETLANIRVVFFQECDDLTAQLETGLLSLQEGERDPELINSVFRAVHSIKGSAGIFGFNQLVRFAHGFESVLSDARAERLTLDDEVVRVLLRAADLLSDLIQAARDETELDRARLEKVEEALAALSTPESLEGDEDDDLLEGFTPTMVSFDDLESPGDQERIWIVRFRPRWSLYAKANEPLNLLRDLSRLGATVVTLDEAALPQLGELDPEEAYLGWTVEVRTSRGQHAIHEVFEFVEGDCDLEIAEAEAAAEPAEAPVAEPAAPAPIAAPATSGTAPAAAPTIRVDLDRVDRLINLVSELVINQSMLSQGLTDAGLANRSELRGGIEELDRLTREIQDSVMAIRAQPVKAVFQRMSRLVREVEAATGKQVRLVTEGEATEVDRTVIEGLTDPLTHMIRNAIDHGIETAAVRRAAGKSEQGLLRISAAHRAGRIVIEVCDDGGGINRPRVRQIAVEKGLIGADDILTEEEIDNLIFAPGFSTSEEVSDLSGRGVGMDVVKRSVQALGGRIFVSSRPGEGSTFTLSLPLTLAVLDGMLVSVGGQNLVVPLTMLLETVQPRPHEMRKIGPDATLLSMRGAYVPLIDLGRTLGYPPAQASDEHVALLVEDDGGVRAALLVDDILGQRQVVIKSLETNYRPIPGVAAATILGDGRVALILDVNALVASQRQVQPLTDWSPQAA